MNFLQNQKKYYRGGGCIWRRCAAFCFVFFIFFVSWVTGFHQCDGHLKVDRIGLTHPWLALLCNAFVENRREEEL